MNTKRNLKVATVLFIVVSALDIIGIVLQKEFLRYFSKPMVILSLMLLYFLASPSKNKWYILALIFSFGGDVFLLFNGQTYFMFGLGSFLLAHIFYITLVSQQLHKPKTNDILLSFMIFFGLLIGLLFVLKGHLGAMKIPVVIYGLVITNFGGLSFINHLQHKSKASLLMLIGALIFISSDSMLAINKFYNPMEVLNIAVMSSYILAQYVIFRAVTQKSA
ncbi:MAG: lysoplasmalogenase [Flavobacteriales bacterium]|nr:lysoplasmalogenase [Flavobacteriales bacterium]